MRKKHFGIVSISFFKCTLSQLVFPCSDIHIHILMKYIFIYFVLALD